ncbi:MAG: hypothetical protein M3238_03875 [Actinomycetota bacterium]|nr:hypothetical protein [Actinomycetota bacterium]
MHTRQFTRLVYVLALTVALGAIAAPIASAHKGRGQGKKPIGTIASFDGTTLTVTTTAGTTVTATVTEDTQIKIEHRGHHARAKRHGNPSNGALDALAAGNFVLRMKVDDGELDKIRIRPATTEHAPTPSDDLDDDEDLDELEDESDSDLPETESDEDATDEGDETA